MNDHDFRQLLNRFGLRWEGYRKVRGGVKKRVRRHMQQLGCRSVAAYFAVLDQDREARDDCRRLMTVSVSRFLRDLPLWHILENEILPAIIQEHAGRLKVWSAGCACGEEVYSFKIIWHTIEGRIGPLPEPELWATDMNWVYLDKARKGIYPQSSLKEVPEVLRGLYFKSETEGQFYEVLHPLKEGIRWRVHDLLSNPPTDDFQLILLRNSLLTYYENRVKVPAFHKVVNSLNESGFLVIGVDERVPPSTTALSPLSRYPYIFQKVAM